MARTRSPNRNKAFQMWVESGKMQQLKGHCYLNIRFHRNRFASERIKINRIKTVSPEIRTL